MARKIIVAELMAKLKADPAYRKMRAEKAAKLQAAAARWRAEQAPLLKALEAVCWPLNSVWDLVNTATPYPEAVPVCLRI